MKFDLVTCTPIGFGSSNQTVSNVEKNTKEDAISYFNNQFPNLCLDKTGYCKHNTITICVAEVFDSFATNNRK